MWSRVSGCRARSRVRTTSPECSWSQPAAALAEATSHLPPAEARRREGAIIYLASLPAWITVSEECGLSAEDAQLGIAWAISSLVADLRRENQAARAADT